MTGLCENRPAAELRRLKERMNADVMRAMCCIAVREREKFSQILPKFYKDFIF